MEQNVVLETIKNRRSIRKYQAKQVPADKLEAVLEAGQYAPTGGNSQSIHFLVIQDEKILAQLRTLVESEFAKMEPYEGMNPSVKGSCEKSKKGGYDFTYGAPTVIVVSNRRGYANALADSACALMNMMLAADSVGLGSCWVNQLHWLEENEAVREFLAKLGLPMEETICGGLSLGIADGERQPPLPRTGNKITYAKA